jgi:phage terminase large subunit GpA-like protein
MIKMMATMENTSSEIKETKNLAQDAKTEASEAKAIALTAVADIEAIKRDITSIKNEKVPVQALPAHQGQLSAGANDEQKRRTITFGNFPEDTKSEFIIQQIEARLQEVKGDLDSEGVFAFGKRFATRGAARFKTEQAMWQYLRSDGAKQHFEVNGVRVYMNRDVRKTPADEAKDKAVRKLVRAIIETEGGRPSEVKTNIDTDYRRGIVRYKDLRIGVYTDGKMQFHEAGSKFEGRFIELME